MTVIIIRLCDNCRREFRCSSERKYCSVACRTAARQKAKTAKRCRWCGEPLFDGRCRMCDAGSVIPQVA